MNKPCKVLERIELRIMRSRARYGNFASTHEAYGVACEEFNELGEAVRSNDVEQIIHECEDLAAVLINLSRQLMDNCEALINRSTK